MHKRTPNGVEFTSGKYTAAEVDDIRAPSVYIWGGTSTATLEVGDIVSFAPEDHR
jgi:hypothetical protein